MTQMDDTFDKMFLGEGTHVGGVDESGITDIAGPLVAACVVMPRIDRRNDDLRIFEVNDSKKIPEKYRKQHAEIIWQTAVGIGIGEVQPSEVDYLGRFEATRLAMMRAVLACKTTSKGRAIKPNFLIVDGNRPVQVKIKQACINYADEKSLCVASASIVAKVYRDEIMIKLHEKYPHYDWIHNKGFPSEKHLVGLDHYGLQLGIHRIRSWPFVRQLNYKEDQLLWIRRRSRWKKLTKEKLIKEIGPEHWTKNPPLFDAKNLSSTASQESKSSQ